MAATWEISSWPATGTGGCADGGRKGRLGGVDADLHLHGVGTGGDVLEALVDDGLGQHGGGGGAVAGDVLGLGGGFLEQLCTHVLEGVVELDVTGHGDAVMGDGGRAVLLVERDVAALGAERGADGIGERVDAGLQAPASLFVVGDELGHLASLWCASCARLPRAVTLAGDVSRAGLVTPVQERGRAPVRWLALSVLE